MCINFYEELINDLAKKNNLMYASDSEYLFVRSKTNTTPIKNALCVTSHPEEIGTDTITLSP